MAVWQFGGEGPPSPLDETLPNEVEGPDSLYCHQEEMMMMCWIES